MLLRQAGLTYDRFTGVAPEAVQAVRAGDTVRAIEVHPAHTGAGLKVEKDDIDQLKAHLHAGLTSPNDLLSAATSA